jgi:hypothetical protein
MSRSMQRWQAECACTGIGHFFHITASQLISGKTYFVNTLHTLPSTTVKLISDVQWLHFHLLLLRLEKDYLLLDIFCFFFNKFCCFRSKNKNLTGLKFHVNDGLRFCHSTVFVADTTKKLKRNNRYTEQISFIPSWIHSPVHFCPYAVCPELPSHPHLHISVAESMGKSDGTWLCAVLCCDAEWYDE